MLLGVALNAMTDLLGRVVRLPQPMRLGDRLPDAAVLLSGVLVLGGATIAQQATVLSNTIKSQLSTVKSFLEKNGVDTSYFDLGNAESCTRLLRRRSTRRPARPASRTICRAPARWPPAAARSSSQTLKVLLGTVSVVGNFFIVLFLGLAFAAQPAVYRAGLIFMAPAKYRARTTEPSSTASARRWSAGCWRRS